MMASSPARTHMYGLFCITGQETEAMTPLTKMMKRLADPREGEAMHLFDAEAREELTLCGATAFIHDRITLQYCLRQLIDGNPVGNVCRACMVQAACWAEGHCRKLKTETILLQARALRLRNRDAKRYRNSIEEAELEADRLLKRAQEYRRLADTLSRETGQSLSDGWTV